MSEARARLFALDKRSLRDSFARAAAGYDAAAVLQREIADRLLEHLDVVRHSPGVIADCGCGTGYGTRALARRYPPAHLLALDLAWPMARRARRRASGFARALARRMTGRPVPGFVCGDIEHLPLATGSVDLVLSNLALQWCDPQLAFREFRRVLAPDGLLVFSTFGPDTLKELRAAWRAVDAEAHVHEFPDMHDLGDLLVHAGFSDPVLDVDRLTLTYAEVVDVLRDLKALGAHNAAQTRTRGLTGKRRFARFRSAYEQFRRSDGRVPATYEVVYAHAWVPARDARPAHDGSAAFPLEALRRRRR
jgi:malonyl-CoA O-methyltransferase